ncbi:hypothetical protein CRG98_017586 [Punica granatum]|uniref:Uncharacterized protein n=1 Tax=Punica granatum TaxID=22663 RepID=A0A2I0K1K2_PUNGR|nr:hypothetical protein CRG98_017586 [Punica granatum]
MGTGRGTDRTCPENRRVAGGRGTAVGAGGGGYGLVKVCSVGGVRASTASSSAMLVAIWLIVPSSAAMRAWSSEAEGICEACAKGAPKDIGG